MFHPNPPATLLSVGKPTPWGRLPDFAATLVFGHATPILVIQLPRRERGTDRDVLIKGAIAVGIQREGTSALLAWYWSLPGRPSDDLVFDTPFHLGLEAPGHRKLPVSEDGTMPVIVVIQDKKGRCTALRAGSVGAEVTAHLVEAGQQQIIDARSADFELRHRRTIKMMMSLGSPLYIYEQAIARDNVAPPSWDATQH
ncbi:MAG: hypothetical protein KIS86_11515 [Devosia sp.]|nr:hypothetical protein [Devosia sp.]